MSLATSGGGAATVGGAEGGASSGGAAGTSLGGAGGAEEPSAASAGASADAGEPGTGGAAPCRESGQCGPEEGPLLLSYDSKGCPSERLTSTAQASYFVGGIDRYVLQLSWACSDFGTLGAPSRAELQVRLAQPSTPPLSAEDAVFSFPAPAPMSAQYVVSQSDVWIRGSGTPEVESKLTVMESELTIRRAEGRLIGVMRYVGTSASGTRVELRAPFDVATPMP